MNLLDIVIVNYKSTDYLLRCLRSVYDALHEVPAKVFVEDNASEDGVDRVKAEFPQVILSKNRYNMGFARAINSALKQSDSPYVVLLNPDTYVMDGFFEPLLRYMEENPDVGVIGPQILNHDGSVQGSARRFPTPLTALFGRSTLLTKWFPNNRFTSRNVLTSRTDGITPVAVDWVSGACMVVRRKAIDDVGLMDERFFVYWEDADWCKRMWGCGWKVVYFPQACVVHYVGVSSGKIVVRSVVEFHKSSYRLFEKHTRSPLRIGRPLVFWALAIRLLCVLFSHGLRQWAYRLKSHAISEETLADVRAKEKIKVLRIIARLNIGGPAIHVALLTHGLDPTRFESTLITGKVSLEEGDMSYLVDALDEKVVMIPELQRELNPIKDMKSLFRVLRILSQEKPDIVHTHTAKAGAIGRIAVFVHNLVQSLKFKTQILVQRTSPGKVANPQSAIPARQSPSPVRQDFVQANSGGLQAMAGGRNPQCKVVHTFHGHVFRGYFGKLKSLFLVWAERLLAIITDIVVVVSESQKKELCSNYHIAPASKFKTVKLGFDLEPFFSAERQKGLLRRNIWIDSETILVGIVGRLVPIKNHKMFLESAKIFLDHNPNIPIKFLIIGDGELRNDLVTFCEQQGLYSYVKFCGWERDLPKVYADLDVLCLTSINEGTPVSIIEAMASSVPVVSTDAGGVRELICGSRLEKSTDFAPVKKASPRWNVLRLPQGKRFTGQGFRSAGMFSSRQVLLTTKEGEFEVCERGILVKPGDAEGFAKGLQYLLKQPDLRRKMGQREREYALKHHSKDRLIADMDRLYRSLLE